MKGTIPVVYGKHLPMCTCGNTARLGETLCGRCLAAAEAEEHATHLLDAVRNAASDLPEGPLSRFADAVVAWMEENR